MVGSAGGFLKSMHVSGWNIWTINSTGIRIFADEGQQLHLQQVVQEQQTHLTEAASLAAALRGKLADTDSKVGTAS